LHAYQDAPLITAGVWTGVTWLLVLTCAANRQAALAAARERDALRRRETTALARLTETPPVADIRLGYVPGLLVLVLALAATAVVIAAQLLDWPAMVDAAVPPLVMSIVIWLLVLANAVSRIKARCARTLVARLHRQNRVALGTVQSAPGLISALQPDGRRTRTNGAWTAVTGCSETVLLEHGWLDIVHTEDREACRSSFADPDAPPTQLEFSIVAADGGNRWIRERIAPRLDDDGTVLELIACGVDVTEHVRPRRPQDARDGDRRTDRR
jgi:PAS domain S-box-containing protein